MNEPINSLYPEDINEEINNRKRKRDEDLIDLQLKKQRTDNFNNSDADDFVNI